MSSKPKAVATQDGKFVFGTVKVGEKGQIVIPKEARDLFEIRPGDTLLVLGDKGQEGIALTKASSLKALAMAVLGLSENDLGKEQKDK